MRVVTTGSGKAIALLSSLAPFRLIRGVPVVVLEGLDATADVLKDLPIQRNSVVLRQPREGVYLFVQRDGADVVGALRRLNQAFTFFALLVASPAVGPEAVLAVVAQTPERFPQVVDRRARGENVSLGAGHEVRRREIVDEPGQNGALLHRVVD